MSETHDTVHTVAVERGGRVEGLRRRIYRLSVGRGKGALVCRSIDDSVTIGSHAGNGLCIADPTVSRFHARIELDRHGFLLTDLDSTNGTYVGGMRVGAVYLPLKAKLQLGDVEVLFEVQSEAQELPLAQADRFGALLGQSAAMRRLFEELKQVAESDATVLLSGETGTGKDLAAAELHRHSARRDRPFVVVDCGGLPETLIEAELFGHERGAFTGANAARAGAFEEADGGTLFLDEVAELSMAMQVKLLRAIEARTVKRLGSNDWRKVDVRVMTATHQDLARLCNQRLFREDLYFRLAVVKLRMPPLRERLDDLPLLVQAALDETGGAQLHARRAAARCAARTPLGGQRARAAQRGAARSRARSRRRSSTIASSYARSAKRSRTSWPRRAPSRSSSVATSRACSSAAVARSPRRRAPPMSTRRGCSASSSVTRSTWRRCAAKAR